MLDNSESLSLMLMALHSGELGLDEVLLYGVPALLGLLLFWALSRQKAPEPPPSISESEPEADQDTRNR